jgi:hypothetical protein
LTSFELGELHRNDEQDVFRHRLDVGDLDARQRRLGKAHPAGKIPHGLGMPLLRLEDLQEPDLRKFVFRVSKALIHSLEDLKGSASEPLLLEPAQASPCVTVKASFGSFRSLAGPATVRVPGHRKDESLAYAGLSLSRGAEI